MLTSYLKVALRQSCKLSVLSAINIVGLVMGLSTLLVVIAGPLNLWQANSIPEHYEYHIDVQWWVLPLTGLLALTLAAVTVGTQAFCVATSNPVDSLKTE